ncbi:toll/interleukin-1 receptor domain-containing protein [Streptomyces coelicoflavus]|uniref:toll/interleukin-1 receptor domain-containing protein n=1 Tax=Streptomyces coelicoflavus TaxID=285562 RepID=UPI003644ADC5
MRIFISWSGEMAKQCAEALRDWLPYMNQAIDPFVSSQDISKGERGLSKIADQLQECSFGIVCVTRENQSAPWINFESGALSRELGDSALIPFLLDMQVKDLDSGPITQFQAVDGSNKEDVWAMVRAVNGKCETTVELDRLRTTFDRFWQDIESQLNAIREAHPNTNAPQRDMSEILDELVKLVRDQHTRIGALEKAVESSSATHYTINEPKGEVRISADLGEVVPNSTRAARVSRAATMTRQILGDSSVERVVRRAGGLEVSCTEEGVGRVREAHRELNKVATHYNVSIDVFGPDSELIAAHAPF